MYSRDTEIRHLSSADVFKFVQIFQQYEKSWQKLMKIIPKNLPPSASSASVSIANETSITATKYNNEHIRLIEKASFEQKRNPMEILLEEWGTSGKKRPTVGNLLELLIKAELFRAADYVALNFLNEPPPERPLKGPAAKIDISIPLLSEDIHEVEKILDDAQYPGTRTLLENVQQISSEMTNNKDFYEKVTFDNKRLSNMIETNSGNTTTTTTTRNISKEPSTEATAVMMTDLIKFSSGTIENNTKIILTENNIPILSELNYHSNSNTAQILGQSTPSSSPSLFVPKIVSNDTNIDLNVFGNGIVKSNESHEIEIKDELQSENTPILSVLQIHHHENDKKIGDIDSLDLPNLSILNGDTDNNSKDDDRIDNHKHINGNDNDDDNVDVDVDDDDDDDNLDFEDGSQNDSMLNDSSISSISRDSNALTPNLSMLDQSNSSSNVDGGSGGGSGGGGGGGLNDSSLTTVTETSDDSSFSCDGGGGGIEDGNSKQSDQTMNNDSINNIPCISALNN